MCSLVKCLEVSFCSQSKSSKVWEQNRGKYFWFFEWATFSHLLSCLDKYEHKLCYHCYEDHIIYLHNRHRTHVSQVVLSYWQSKAVAVTEEQHLYLEKVFCCHINVTAEVKNSYIWLHIGTGQICTDGLGWTVVKPQQLRNCVQDRPGAKRFISFAAADYFMHQPEHNFHSLLCLKKFYFSDQILIHKVIRNSHMVLSLHVFVWKEVSGLQEGHILVLLTTQTAPFLVSFNPAK